MIYKDQNKKEIKDNDVLLFTHEDSVEPTGFCSYATNVKLCFWSENEKRYIPHSEINKETLIEDCQVINLKTENKS